MSPLTRWLKNLLVLAIVGCLAWYLSNHWNQLKELLKLSPTQLLAMYVITFIVFIGSGGVVQCLLNALKTNTKFWDMVWLNNTATMLNYAPMKFGTLFRANYLKRHYRLPYSHFATFFIYITFLMTATAAAVGLIALITVYGLVNYENKIMAAVFVTILLVTLILLFIPVPKPHGKGKFSKTIKNFLDNKNTVAKDKKAILISIIILTINFLLTAIRIGIIYHSLGQKVHPAGCLIIGALGFVVVFIGITPGELGIREVVLGFGAVALNVPLEIGLMAAVIDRAIILSYAFVVGGICTIWLWHKSPTDFKKNRTSLLED